MLDVRMAVAQAKITRSVTSVSPAGIGGRFARPITDEVGVEIGTERLLLMIAAEPCVVGQPRVYERDLTTRAECDHSQRAPPCKAG
jgi:hypothetical protein